MSAKNRERIQSIQKHFEELCVDIGPRPVGSRNNQRAQSYIGSVLGSNGMNVEFLEFDCIDWQPGTISLSVGGNSVNAAISPFSLSCDISARYEVIGTLEQLEHCELSCKIAVLHDELTKESIMPKNFKFWNPEEHQRINRLLEEKKPEAVITISFSDELPVPIIEDDDFDIPCAVVSKRAGQGLLNGDHSELHLRIESKRINSKGANVIARRNIDKEGKRIVACAHLDTKPGTPGALDDASGIVTLLTLSELLRDKPIGIGLELVAFNGEDSSPSGAGEVAYIEKYRGGFSTVAVAVNSDGLGLRNSRIGMSYMGCGEKDIELWENIRRRSQLVELIDPWYQGDHMIFVAEGVPVITLTSSGFLPLIDKIVHTDRDNIDVVDPEIILGASELLENLVLCPNSY